MKRRLTLSAAIILLAALFFGCDYLKCHEVRAVIEELDSDDELVVRGSVRKLSELADSACIGEAVDPLADILFDESRRHDVYTRSLVPSAFSRIAAYNDDWPQASVAVDPLVKSLFEEQVRLEMFQLWSFAKAAEHGDR